MRYRIQGNGRVELRSDPIDFVYARCLQSANGALRSDAERLIERDTFGSRDDLDLETFLAQKSAHMQGDFSDIVKLQLSLLTTDQPTKNLAEIAKRKDLRIYRLGTHRTGSYRIAFWRLVEQLCAGVQPADVSFSDAAEGSLLGLIVAVPGTLICGPMVARFQPMAAVLHLPKMAQIALVAAQGAGFVRPMHFDSWPVAFGGASVGGSGKGAYVQTIKEFEPGEVEELLEWLVAGTNRLLNRLTDPAKWVGSDGTVDFRERLIAWTSVQFGTQALMSLGSDWASRSSLWESFRALGILQGVWEGKLPNSVPLSEILDPTSIRNEAISSMDPGNYQNWCNGVVNNYEDAILRAFPGRSLEEALILVADIRNLVHGVGGRKGKRSQRIDSLKALATSDANIDLLKDVAVLWWAAVLLDPDRFFLPGRKPWA